MDENKLILKIENEFILAKKAVVEGKIGMARVCARRAAGWTIQLKLNQEGVNLKTVSAFEHIKYYYEREDIDPEIKKILEYLQLKVNKDSLEEESYWPLPKIDLIKEAERLFEILNV